MNKPQPQQVAKAVDSWLVVEQARLSVKAERRTQRAVERKAREARSSVPPATGKP